MQDAQWRKLQEQLKAIGPGAQDGPPDRVQFQDKVLQEYRRRSRHELRTKWLRRTIAVATVCVAVWADLLITNPLDHVLSGVATGKGIKNGPAPTANDPATPVYQFFDLYLQKRPELANRFVADSAIAEVAAFPLNRSNPHMTGFTLQQVNGQPNQITYQVALNWGTYGRSANLDTYQVEVSKRNGHWLISRLQKVGEVAFEEQQDGSIRYIDGQSTTAVIMDRTVPAGARRFFAINPYDDKQLVYAEQQGSHQVLYKWQADRAPQKVATLPNGESGEIFWMENDLLALNFQPAGTTDQDQILFYDAKTGAQKFFPLLEKNLTGLHFVNAHVVHTLPGQQLRIRSGALSMLIDLQNNSMAVSRDPNSHEEASELEQVLYDAVVHNLPQKDLQIYYPEQMSGATLGTLGVPANKRIDPQKETGMYVLGGSVQGMTLVGHDLQIEVSADPGRVEVWAVPLKSLQQYAGQSIRVQVYDDSGYVVAPAHEVRVPSTAK